MHHTTMTTGTDPGTGVVYTEQRVACIMVREAMRSRLAIHFSGSENQIDQFMNGSMDTDRAQTWLQTVRAFSFLDPAVGEGIFIREYIHCLKNLHRLYQVWQPDDWIPDNLTGFEIDETVPNRAGSCPWQEKIRYEDYLLSPVPPVDIIVGNPPYIRQELIDRTYKDHIFRLVQNQWPELTLNKRMDMYAYFLFKALADLKPGGVCTFIIPNTWLDSDYGAAIRHLVSTGLELVAITDSRHRHFAVDVNTVIVTFRRRKPGSSILLRVDRSEHELPVRILRQLDLPWSGWIFRCPDWVRQLLDGDQFQPLDSLFHIKTGIITGNNARYYSEKNDRGEPALKSPREVKSILWEKEQARYYVQNDHIPYTMKKAPLLWPDLRGSRHVVVWNRDNLAFEHTFYGLEPLVGEEKKWALLLNSTWVWLMVEIFGRHNLGGGAIRLVKSGLRTLPLPIFAHGALPEGVDTMLTRPIGNGDQELSQPDRRRLDRWILRSLGQEKYLDQLYADTSRLMSYRIKKAARS
ncbi:MAG: Eco57I restriction-modification methylase domain-containing protein [Fidelibacterota bacterium]